MLNNRNYIRGYYDAKASLRKKRRILIHNSLSNCQSNTSRYRLFSGDSERSLTGKILIYIDDNYHLRKVIMVIPIILSIPISCLIIYFVFCKCNIIHRHYFMSLQCPRVLFSFQLLFKFKPSLNIENLGHGQLILICFLLQNKSQVTHSYFFEPITNKLC